MSHVIAIARWEGFGFLAGLSLIVLWKIITGEISLDGLLVGDRRDGSEFFSPGRLQMLIFSVVTAVNYVVQVAKNPATDSLPPISHSTLVLLAGSHGLYLAGKARSMLLGSFSQYLKELFK